MKSKVVAALLSGLVFPGVGQYYLGRRGRGIVFVGVAAVAGLLYFSDALDQANALAGQVLGGSMPLDPAAIAARVEAQPTPPAMRIAGIVFALCWVGSIVEALLTRPE